MDLMKREVYLLVAVLMMVVGLHCKKSNTPAVWTGKLVVLAACDHYVVQLQYGPVPDSSVLTKSWTDPATDSTYTNVFGVSDVCTFAAADLNVGDVFTFTLNGPVPVLQCYICLVVPFGMPAANNSVTNIKITTIH
jgi:hypothetical protein